MYFEPWNSKVNEQDRFSKIRDAIIGRNVISFDYVNAEGNKGSRFAEPVKLIFNANTWYLIAYCLKRNTYRMFRLSRIKNVEITNRSFSEHPAPEYEKQTNYHTSLVDLRLRCDRKVLSRLYDTFDGEYISKNDDDTYDLIATIPEDEWVYGYILSLGEYAEVLEPEHIRKIIKARIKGMFEKY